MEALSKSEYKSENDKKDDVIEYIFLDKEGNAYNSKKVSSRLSEKILNDLAGIKNGEEISDLTKEIKDYVKRYNPDAILEKYGKDVRIVWRKSEDDKIDYVALFKEIEDSK